MHPENIEDSTNPNLPIGVLGGGCDLSEVQGVRVQLPYLWGHSANGGQVIPSAHEVRSVDLQLKVAQPLDNGL